MQTHSILALAAVFALAGYSSEQPAQRASAPTRGSVPPSGDLPILREGPITPGTYVVMPPEAGWAECPPRVDCSPAPPHARSMQVEITVPSGWVSRFESTVIHPLPGTSHGPDGAGLVMVGGHAVGLHSDPCLPNRPPDILIGPTVEDFVEAIVAYPMLEVSEPVDIELGGYAGQFLTLTAPSDLSDCPEWRPWEPGIYAQGPDNIWNVWVIDVDGLLMIVLAQEFRGTSAEDSAELRAMVESIRFVRE